ncbi:SDR family oxidoreductase [Natronoarchaeum sp. GCM10025703]|uniref:SDR family oxidoreductase n=1 Tax=Natronoarchaeum sp. GCM10025703 TaxID=3252685 RepID=UPI00361E5F7C
MITGGASGMGKSMAHEFADEGASVVAVDVDEGVSRRLPTRSRATVGRRWRSTETSDDLWHGVLDVNLNGPFYLTRAALPELLEGDDEGVVINTASIAGKVAGGGGSAYTTSKHGLIGFTKQLAHDYGPELRANAICPGAVETGMTDDLIEEMEAMTADTPAGRYAAPEEIATVAVFLAAMTPRSCTVLRSTSTVAGSSTDRLHFSYPGRSPPLVVARVTQTYR